MISARPLLVIGILTAVAASWLHLAGWMSRYETADQWWIAALAATAVDIGLLASLRTIGELAMAGQSTRDAKAVVFLFVVVSFAANVQHALAVKAGDVANAVAVSGVLPLAALAMSHLYDVISRPVTVATTAAPRRQTTGPRWSWPRWPRWPRVRWPWSTAPVATTATPTMPPAAEPPTSDGPAMAIDGQSADGQTTATRPRPTTRPATATDPRVAAAIAAGVARTTARRWAATGNPKLDRYQTTEARAA